MRWSSAHIPTLRDDPADAEAPSHRLLVRAGYVRQLMSGVYSMLPLALRVRAKVAQIIREEMDAIGCQEFLLPAIHPADLWRKSGRWDLIGAEMFRLKDRRDVDLCLGMTHEEVFAVLAGELESYRQLPQAWYQVQTKFRDEPRPKSGVLRTREFTMKDAYTFDIDDAGLDAAFEKQRGAYVKIFKRLGFDAVQVEASSGLMGGSDSVEFMVRAEYGEDTVVYSSQCGYAANLEKATSRLDAVTDEAPPGAPQKFPTPGVRTIDALVESGAPADRQIKTMVYLIDDAPVLVLMRGDHQVQAQKLMDHAGTEDIRAAGPEEIRGLLGADPGSLGAVGLADIAVWADMALSGRTNLFTGANEDDFHLSGVDVERDIVVERWLDLREVVAGQPCPECGEPLELFDAIESGHIFKLGRHYAEALGATVMDADGKEQVITMGSYGIGVERNMAAIVEASHDEHGIVWPTAVAPYHVVVTLVGNDDGAATTAEAVYEQLKAMDVEVLFDDRDERPGVKFADAELIGVPYRVTIGPKGLAAGTVELSTRATGESTDLDVDGAAAAVSERVRADLAGA
ncbi:MAG: proline--tRNA ligase [Acidimicrobiia bacterium]